jgi:FkbM family methyltransferase
LRLELLYNPRLLCERAAEISRSRRRLGRLRGTAAHRLALGHIDTLELLELIRPLHPNVIFDIGANEGTWTLLAKAVYPDAEVHAFEPLEVHRRRFSAATHALPGISLHPVALGSKSGTQTMEVLVQSDASSLLSMTAECGRLYGLTTGTPVPVPVRTLDALMLEKTVAAPHLVKLDVQGYEMEVLRGGEQALRSAAAVISEVSFIELYKGQCLFNDLSGFLAERGFRLFALGERTSVGRRLVQADALFVAETAYQRLVNEPL